MKIDNPFLQVEYISSDDVLALLLNYQFIEPNYHSDDFGHIQVETPLQTNEYSINDLIHMIELKQLWPRCMKQLASKDEPWLLKFSAELKKEDSDGALNCLVKLTCYFQSLGNKLVHLQDAAHWSWSFGTISQLEKIQRSLLELQQCLQEDPLTTEIDLCIIKQALTGLKPIKAKFK